MRNADVTNSKYKHPHLCDPRGPQPCTPHKTHPMHFAIVQKDAQSALAEEHITPLHAGDRTRLVQERARDRPHLVRILFGSVHVTRHFLLSSVHDSIMIACSRACVARDWTRVVQQCGEAEILRIRVKWQPAICQRVVVTPDGAILRVDDFCRRVDA